MEKLPFFDADCRIGINEKGDGAVVKDLLEDMEYYGIDRALVRTMLTFTSPVETNRQIAEIVKANSKQFTGVWYFLPDHCDEMPKCEAFFAAMKENGIGALSFNPEEHHYVANRITIGRIMDAAAERKIPILLDAFGYGQWNELYNCIREFPKNTFLFIDKIGKWGSDRNIRPLLENFENFYFATALYWVPEGIYEMAAKYGADRIVYSSGFPVCNQGNGMLQLKQSKLSDEAIAKIAYGNLDRIIKGAQL